MRRNSPWICTMAVTAAFVATAAGDPTIDASKSSIIATFRQEKVPVDAPLKKFNGRIDYNAAQPNAAKAALEVNTASLDMGSSDYDAEVRKKDWMDSGTYPKASFISTSVKPGATGHFDATGTVSVCVLPFSVRVPVASKCPVAPGLTEVEMKLALG